MRWLNGAGYLALSGEVLFVLMLAVTRDMGDDAAGRGMALGFAILLGPLVLVAGALFVWGTHGGPTWAHALGLAMVMAPPAWGVVQAGGSALRSVELAVGRARYGRFDDPHTTRVARAIDAVDLPELHRLLAQRPPDFTARDPYQHTLLGHAVFRALEYGRGPAQIEPLRVLLAAGAPPARDALSPERTPASVSDHELIYAVFGVGSDQAAAVLDVLLSAGADPNVRDEDDRPLWFSTYARRSTLEVLTRHGVTFAATDPRRDTEGYTALMQRVAFRDWDLARFFLAHGADVAHVSTDGSTVRSLLAEVDPPGSVYAGDDAAAHDRFLDELAAAEARAGGR